MTIPIPIYATSLSSLEGIFYTVTKANIYAAPMCPQECTPHFLVSIFHPTPFLCQEADCSLCIHAVLARLFHPSLSIPDCRLYYCCHLHSVPGCCLSTATQEGPAQLSVRAGCHTDLSASEPQGMVPVVSPSLQFQSQKERDQQMLGKCLNHAVPWMKQQACKERRQR